jgi:hypothetical protein
MQELFKAAVERGASDIRIKAGDFMRPRSTASFSL